MVDSVDAYLKEIIGKGDVGSDLLERKTALTLKNNEFADVYPGKKRVLHTPFGYSLLVHSATGDMRETDPASHAASMAQRLVESSRMIGALPIAFGDVIDSNTGDIPMLESIADAMVSVANDNRLVIINGENAILGARVNPDVQANVMGTMISLVKESELLIRFPNLAQRGMDRIGTTSYAVFDPQGMAVHMNCDGIGTKTEFYERTKRYSLGVADFAAMNLDDTAKSGARALGLFGTCEMSGDIPLNDILMEAGRLGQRIGVPIFLEPEHAGNRIMSYRPGVPAFNISGATVSLIDKDRLMNPPKPSAGEYLVAIRGRPNPRSNGITDKRMIAVELCGPEYQDTPEGRDLLEFLAEPSTVLYPVFKSLLDEGVATSVYHMSGGAYKGKLAKPLANAGIYAEIDNLFEPDRREIMISNARYTSINTAYAKWPMGNDGFITTKDPDKAIRMIESMGLEAKVAGRLFPALEADGEKYGGANIRAYNDKEVIFLYELPKAA
ncbi:MAG: hypothetical protein KKE20_05930 [Nanoarchaeota archaeon]|nr:hypothetical protein [Nanoarchaeota archaeon]